MRNSNALDTELSEHYNVCPVQRLTKTETKLKFHVCDIVFYISPKITEESARKVPLIISHSSFQNHISRFIRVVARKCHCTKVKTRGLRLLLKLPPCPLKQI